MLFYQLRWKYYFAKLDGKNVTGIGIYLLITDEKSGVRTKPPKGLLVIILFRVLISFFLLPITMNKETQTTQRIEYCKEIGTIQERKCARRGKG